MTSDELLSLLRHCGEALEPVDAIARISETEFVISIAQTDVYVDLIADGARLIVSTALGVPSEENAPAVHDFLLTVSGAWTSTGGIGFGRKPDGELHLFYGLASDRTDPLTMGTVIVDIGAKGAAVRAVIEAGAAEPGALVAASSPETMIRA